MESQKNPLVNNNILVPLDEVLFDFHKINKKQKIKKFLMATSLVGVFCVITFFGTKLIEAKLINFKTPSDNLNTNTNFDANKQSELTDEKAPVTEIIDPIVPSGPSRPKNNTQNIKVEPVVTKNPIESPTAVPETQEQWKYYTNSDYNYTLKYPSYWDCDSSNTASILLRDSKYSWLISKAEPELQSNLEFKIANSDINIAIFNDLGKTLQQLIFDDGFMTEVKPIKFANYDAYVGISKNLKRNQIVFKKDTNFFILNLSVDQNTSPIKDVLESFSF